MKITKIEVKKLFGVFNHEIPLNTKDHITIIHGPNGYGKTILLSLINAIFNSQYHKLRAIPFSELALFFNDSSILRLRKNDNYNSKKKRKANSGKQLTFDLLKPPAKPKGYTLKPVEPDDLPFKLSFLDGQIDGLDRIHSETWRYKPTQELLSLEEVLERFSDILPRFNYKHKDEPAWLEKVKHSVKVNFIESQRLLLNVSLPEGTDIYKDIHKDEEEDVVIANLDPFRGEYFGKSLAMLPTVIKFSEELSEAIQKKLSEYGSLSQSLDRTFPKRLVNGKRNKGATIEDLKAELNQLEKKRTQITSAGFWDKEKEIDFKDLKKIDESNINALSIYLNDVKQKLGVFDELTDRIGLLIKIINSRFLHKKLSISKADGFIFKSTEGKIIPPTGLSSGEQHELVLLYEMLFKVKPNSLILIDEPEISLHVAWQQEFLKDLQEITRLVGFDVLIATHSPQIINDRWDLTVELKGPKQ